MEGDGAALGEAAQHDLLAGDARRHLALDDLCVLVGLACTRGGGKEAECEIWVWLKPFHPFESNPLLLPPAPCSPTFSMRSLASAKPARSSGELSSRPVMSNHPGMGKPPLRVMGLIGCWFVGWGSGRYGRSVDGGHA